MRFFAWIRFGSCGSFAFRPTYCKFSWCIRAKLFGLLIPGYVPDRERFWLPSDITMHSPTNNLFSEFGLNRIGMDMQSNFADLASDSDPLSLKDCGTKMEGTVFTSSLEGMKHVKSENGVMLTKTFLDVCKLILPVLDKFGAAMSIVKSDIGGNITRLEDKYLSDPSKFEHLYSMVQMEVESETAKGSSSCTNGLLWLTRAMDFLVELFRNLLLHSDWTMTQACTDAYTKTLKKWHGWFASVSFTLAMKLAPDRKKFMEVIIGSGDIDMDMEKFCTTFAPFLEENHKFLASVGLDDLKAS